MIPRHRLKREIVATQTTNSLVNRMGPVFVTRAQEDTGADPAVIARAYTIAREIFAMRALWMDIEALDNRVAAKVQYGMFFRTRACCVTPVTGCCTTATRICPSKPPCASCAPACRRSMTASIRR